MKLQTERGRMREYVDLETGQRYWSVSEVRRCLHDTYAGIPEAMLAPARDRGTRLHARFWRVLAARMGYIPHPAVIPELEGFCLAMDAWAEQIKAQPVLLEHKSVNQKLGYAGTCDAQILYGPKEILTLVDLKTGGRTSTDTCQMLAYNEMVGLKSSALMDLYIQDDGTYKEVFVTAKDKTRDWPAFLNALSVLRWRANHGR